MAESKRNKLCKKSIAETGAVTFTFIDGQTRIAEASQFSDEIRQSLLAYGIAQKLGDAYAGTKSAKEAVEEFDGVLAELLAGNWKASRESTGPKAGKTVRAVLRIGERNEDNQRFLRKVLAMGKSVAWDITGVRDHYAKLDDTTKKTVATSSEVKLELAEMAKEEATQGATSLFAS